MSLGPGSMFRPIFRAFPFFFVVFLTLLIFLTGLIIITKIQLQEQCSRDVSLRLDKYLHERSSSALTLSGAKRKSSGLQGLSFVRLISDNEQFLYAESNKFKVDFQGVVNLDPRSSAVWISLDDVKKSGAWTIASRELDNGLIVQAGMECTSYVDLYSQVRFNGFMAVVVAFFVACGVAYFCLMRSTKPLREAEEAVARIVTMESSGLLDVQQESDVTGLYVLLNDLISQNRQLVKEMQGSLDNVAHDLRTPMTRLRSVAEYGLQQNSNERLAEALSDCLEESERVLSMLGIMMSVAEAESGTMQLHKEAVKLIDTIKDIINLYEYVADEKNITMEMDIDSDIFIAADKTRISQVWANIVDNAIKYGKEGGYVRIYAESDESFVSILIEDNGMGISANELHKIWERLFRGDRSRSQQGLGLGLNYVRAVVEAHGGEVFVNSRLGEGACFKVKLPKDPDENSLFSQTQLTRD